MIQPESKQNDVLIVDDTPENLKILMQILTEQGYLVRPVLNGELALQVVQKAIPDLILLDILMPGTDGYEVCRRLKAKERTRNIPIIFISALDETMDKVKAFDLGGVDYITKPFQAEEVLARVKTHLNLRNMQIQMQAQNQQLRQEIRERKQSDQALHDSEVKLGSIMNAVTDSIILLDAHGKIIYSNPASGKIFGYTVQELKNKTMKSLLISEEFKTTYNPADGKTFELKAIRKNGTVFPVDFSFSAMQMNDEWYSVGIVRDITERMEMQEEIDNARKLDSLGILTGGIAHDLNNLLSVIIGNINLAERDVKPEIGRSKFLNEAEKACFRITDLTKQFTTLSIGGAPVKKSGSIGDLLMETVNFLLPKFDVRYDFFPPNDLWPVKFDRGQMKQAVKNLMINAAESMPAGGSIIIKAENIKAGTETASRNMPFEDGNYVKIIIRDSGIGILEKNLIRIFDPYFSTKSRGVQKGMGLGLTIAWSVITRHGGRLTVESEIGTGTVVSIFLPAYEKNTEAQKIEKTLPSTLKSEEKPTVRTGKILLMDDEMMIRELADEMLSQNGYNAELACDGAEAIELYKSAMNSGKPFDAVILDLTIKEGIGGKATVKALLEIDSHVKAIVSSGYSEDPAVIDFKKYGFCGSLGKPYTMKKLIDILTAILK
ncbi:response regulator [Desulfococcaceae bacterium HSG7]|nr:response regulator [Desulfococcaceae bacterium HSG7]